MRERHALVMDYSRNSGNSRATGLYPAWSQPLVSKAVGVEYGEVLQARRARKAASSARKYKQKWEARGGIPGYYNPSHAQREAQSARRAQQKVQGAEQRANREYQRRSSAPPPLRSHFHSGPVSTVLLSSGVAGASGLAIHQGHKRDALVKFDQSKKRTRRDTTLGAIGGAAAADAGSMIGGQTLKAGLARNRAKVGMSQHDQEVWRKHKAKHGLFGRSTKNTPNKLKVKIHSTYPKELPGWRLQRALAFKNRPSVYAGTLAAGAVGGAALAHHRSVVQKSARTAVARPFKAMASNKEAVVRTTAMGIPGGYVAYNLRPVKKKKPVVKRYVSDKELRHRKNVQAGLAVAGSTLGLSALGVKGAGMGARKFVQEGSKFRRVAERGEKHSTGLLTVGAGVGGVGGFNSASISRAEAKRPQRPLKRNYTKAARYTPPQPPQLPQLPHHKADENRQLIRQHGLKGSPEGVDRATRQKIWEARSEHLNRRRDQWHRRANAAEATEKTSGTVAALGSAAIGGASIRDKYKSENPEKFQAKYARAIRRTHGKPLRNKLVHRAFTGSPGYKSFATVGAATLTAAGARRARTISEKKTRKYSTASGGIASGTAERMKDYDH